MSLPATKQQTIVQGQTFLYAVRRVTNRQVIDLGVSGGGVTGTWIARLAGANSTPTPALAYNATPAEVQTALAALPTVGAGNVTVSDGGCTGKYLVDLVKPEVATTKDLLAIQITPSFTPQTAPAIDWANFDWTGWTATFKVAVLLADGTFDTPYINLTHTANGQGQVIFGYKFPPQEGGVEPTPDPTNGVIAVKIFASATGALTQAQFASGLNVRYALFALTGTYHKAVEDGAVVLSLEPA